MIYEQLSNYCDCIKKVTEQDVRELIDMVSMATCWTTKPCETLELSERKEVIDLPDCLDDCVYEFTPYYHPFIPDTFSFTVIKTVGIDEEYIPVADVVYSEAEEIFKLNLPLPRCECKPCTCGCDPKYKLLVEYSAGYEELPECLLPIFCEALQYIAEKNTCDCGECEVCQAEEVTAIDYEGSPTITDRLRGYLVKMITEQYKRQLALISLCDNTADIWGFVV